MKLKVLSFAAVLALGLNAQVINLDRGWNNVGIINDTPITDFNNSNIKYVWQYNHGRWDFYSPDASLMEEVREGVQNGNLNLGFINSIDRGSALWIYSNSDTTIRVGEVASFTTITGVVKDAITNELINNFSLILDDNREYNFTNGEFTLTNIPLGEHNITIVANNYQPLNVNANLDDSTPLNLGQLHLIPLSANHEVNLSIRVLDATTGDSVNSARIEFFRGYNNTEGEPVKDIVYTGEPLNIELASGEYTVKITADGYYPTVYNYTFASEENETIKHDFVIAPEHSTNNAVMRAVLTWGEYPRDLDSHFIAYDEDTNTTLWHVYYGDKSPSADADLDVDDTTSFGPETTTLHDLNTSLTYKYFVYNYSQDGELRNSDAHVLVYYQGREYNFQVPDENGTLWKVFEIRNGVLIPCVNNCMFNVPTSPNGLDDLTNYRITNPIINEIINSYKTHLKK